MKRTFLTLLLFAGGILSVQAQNPYIVKTNETSHVEGAPVKGASDPTNRFLQTHFPNIPLDEWTPGMTFMVIPDRKDLTMVTFYDAADHSRVNIGQMKHHILEYAGHEITERGYIHFNFYDQEDGKTVYYEVKNHSFGEYCNKPKTGVPSLAYLGDVDKARILLEGQTLYTQAGIYYVDDATEQSGSHEITTPKNTAVRVVAVGVGTRSYPVKIVVRDKKGREFFQNVCMSKTNSGMRDDELIMDEAKHFFPNSFKMANPNASTTETHLASYAGKSLHLKCKLTMDDGTTLRRFTPIKITDLEQVDGGNYYKATFETEDGKQYTKNILFNRQSIIGNIAGENEMYAGDIIGVGDVRRQISKNASKERIEKIAEGKVEVGMTKEECRLAKGDPTNISQNAEKGTEVWSYTDEMNNHNAMVLIFTNGKLSKITQ